MTKMSKENETLNKQQNGNDFIADVICSALSSDEWRRLAGYIDNGFLGSEKTFSAERKNGYYYLNTNKCDDVSMVRVYCKIGVEGIDKIERIGEDTVGWQEINSTTYKNVEKFLRDVRF
jgi:hypothetical protein